MVEGRQEEIEALIKIQDETWWNHTSHLLWIVHKSKGGKKDVKFFNPYLSKKIDIQRCDIKTVSKIMQSGKNIEERLNAFRR